MKMISININEKKYMCGKITAFLSKEAIKIQKEALSLSNIGKNLQENPDNLELVENVLEKLMELKDRKVWLICEVYGNKFTVDDVEKSLTDSEIDQQINQIIFGIYGIVEKN